MSNLLLYAREAHYGTLPRRSNYLTEIPVNEDRVATIVIGGLNPMAILQERGIEVRLRALDALGEYERLFDFRELEDRLKHLR